MAESTSVKRMRRCWSMRSSGDSPSGSTSSMSIVREALKLKPMIVCAPSWWGWLGWVCECLYEPAAVGRREEPREKKKSRRSTQKTRDTSRVTTAPSPIVLCVCVPGRGGPWPWIPGAWAPSCSASGSARTRPGCLSGWWEGWFEYTHACGIDNQSSVSQSVSQPIQLNITSTHLS